jgi:IS605 OrfB family transposase
MIKNKFYKRAVVLKTYCTEKKKSKIEALIYAYRSAVNFYLKFDDLKLDKSNLALLQDTNLSERYKSNALKQAIGIQKSFINKKENEGKIANFKFEGFPILDAKFVNIQTGNNSFDLWIKLSTLANRKRILIPTKKHKRFNYWQAKGKLIQGCELHVDKIIVWFEVEKTYKNGSNVGVDLGMNKLITTSDGEFIGEDFKNIIDKITRKKRGSKSYKRALIERDNYINYCVNQLPWNIFGTVFYENLKNMKKGKSKKRSRKFRNRQQYWTYRKVIDRIIEKSMENRVRSYFVDPRHTSQCCPSCGHIAASNRVNEEFCCLTCGYEQDADFVGATNILRKGQDWTSSLESLDKKVNI